MYRFADRSQAGQALAERLADLRREAGSGRVVVLALPRGGVPVGLEIARRLGAPLDVLVARKLGAPFQPELSMGAIAEDGALFLERRVAALVGATDEDIGRIAAAEEAALERAVEALRGERPLPDVEGRTVVLVDDGVVTGGTLRAAICSMRQRGAARLVVAVPVGAAETLALIAPEVDELVALDAPRELRAVSLWYEAFPKLRDDEIVRMLEEHRVSLGEGPPSEPNGRWLAG